MYWLQARRRDPDTALVFRPRELWPPVVISATCFLMSNLSFVYTDIPFTSPAIEGRLSMNTRQAHHSAAAVNSRGMSER